MHARKTPVLTGLGNMVLKTVKFISKLLGYVYNHIEGVLLALLASVLVLDVLLGIVARYVHLEVVFATELGKYIFIWLSCIGIAVAAKDKQHIRLNFIVERLPIPRKVTWVISQILFLFMAMFFLYWGFQLTKMHYSMNKSAMGFDFPMFVFTLALPIGFAFTSIRLIDELIRVLKKPDLRNFGKEE